MKSVDERGPGALFDARACRRPERLPLGRVADEIAHTVVQIVEVAGAIEPAVHAGADEVDGAAASRRHHGHPTGVCFLDRLTERLALARVHEDVEAGDRLGELDPGEVSEEHRARQRTLQPGTRGAVADDDQPHTRHPGDHGQILHLLLGSESPHVADDDLARSDPLAPRVTATAGVEAFGVDTAAPEAGAIDAELIELRERRRGRGEGERRAGVQAGDVRRGEGRRPRQTVLSGIGDDIGLVDGHGRQIQARRRRDSAPAQHER